MNTVTMLFPRSVKLQVAVGRFLNFDPGPQEVPVEYADHKYLKANGVTRYAPTQAPSVQSVLQPPVAPVPGAPVASPVAPVAIPVVEPTNQPFQPKQGKKR